MLNRQSVLAFGRSSGNHCFVACAALLASLVLFGCRDTQDSSQSASAKQYAYGTKISFTQAGAATGYQVSGWSNPEAQFTWTEGNTAVLAVRVPATQAEVALKMRVAGFLNPPQLTTQPVEVFVNDQKIADWQVGELAEQTAMIPVDVVKSGGLLTFTFRIPKATSPKTAGVAEDPRVLGICVHEVELRKVG